MRNDFSEILNHPYVIIFDKATGNKLHKTSCSFVTSTNFDLKVIKNQENNGYYQPLGHNDKIVDPTVVPCKVCKPSRQ